mmetsp:Transcript_8484/g.19862  ORF Transcript_8484/g.19862 Transcript_8484/m.19862 type:complete len:231 (+) Transcript_8484:1307-1999(+)
MPALCNSATDDAPRWPCKPETIKSKRSCRAYEARPAMSTASALFRASASTAEAGGTSAMSAAPTTPTVDGFSHSWQPEPLRAASASMSPSNRCGSSSAHRLTCSSTARRSAGSASVDLACSSAATSPAGLLTAASAANSAYMAPAFSQTRASFGRESENGPTHTRACRSTRSFSASIGLASCRLESHAITRPGRPIRRIVSQSDNAASSPLTEGASSPRQSAMGTSIPAR